MVDTGKDPNQSTTDQEDLGKGKRKKKKKIVPTTRMRVSKTPVIPKVMMANQPLKDQPYPLRLQV